MTDQVAQVGVELAVPLRGADSDGGALRYTFSAQGLDDFSTNASITVAADGTGTFWWVPLAADLGTHTFTFTVTEIGGDSTSATIDIDVQSAVTTAGAPVFHQPLGTGATIDLATTPCITLMVVVDDGSGQDVTIGEQDSITGAVLSDTSDQTAYWHWCPTAAQAEVSRYTMVLTADDHTHPKTLKDYLLVLIDSSAGSGGNTGSDGSGDGSGSGTPPTCPGAAPAIASVPMDQTTDLDLSVTATISDATAMTDTPLFYYSLSDPGPNPDLTQMWQLTTTLTSGTASNGIWSADVPNPVAGQPDGSSQPLWYVFVADVTTSATCDLTTVSPVYTMNVTAGGDDTAFACDQCSVDAQCGSTDGASNECVYFNDDGNTYCLEACDPSGNCADGFICYDEVPSVDGASGSMCVPDSGSCFLYNNGDD
jgi:hypothetical protein